MTDAGDSEQAGEGDGPATVHVSWTALPKNPFAGLMVIVPVPCVPRFTVKLLGDEVMV